MDSFEFNKISAAVLSGILLLMVISTITGMIYPEPKSDKLAYSVEIIEAPKAGAVVVKGPSLAELMASADVSKGAKEFKKCVACHSNDKGAAHKMGPNLFDILGRDVAAADGFSAYSTALMAQGGQWTYELLDQWVASPKAVVGGTSMAFGGIRKPASRANLIAYLRSLSETPKALPVVEVVETVVKDETAAQ